jgi:hypothetical protein
MGETASTTAGPTATFLITADRSVCPSNMVPPPAPLNTCIWYDEGLKGEDGMPPSQVPNRQDYGRKLAVTSHPRDPQTNVETLRDLLGCLALTVHVPFTRSLDDEEDKQEEEDTNG